jgi:hypothetical protein
VVEPLLREDCGVRIANIRACVRKVDDDMPDKQNQQVDSDVDIFDEKPRPKQHGTTTPSTESVNQYYRALELITAAQQHAEAHSAALFVG